MSHSDPTIPYATPVVGRRNYWPAAILCCTGLGLVALGGCFLIGVMILTNPAVTFGAPGPPAFKAVQWFQLIVLYALAFACFGGATALIVMGARRLN